MRLASDKSQLERYVALANKESNVTFVGRLGTYRYLDMHVTISEALGAADRFLKAARRGEKMPAFTIDPLP